MGAGFPYDFINDIYGFRIVPEQKIKPHFTFLPAQNSDFDSLGLTSFFPDRDGIAPDFLGHKGKIGILMS